MAETYHVEGLKELEAALNGLRHEFNLSRASTKNTVKRALIEAAKPIELAAEAKAPVDVGHLKRSITSGKPLSRHLRSGYAKGSELEIFVGPSSLPQAITQEFGTSDHPAQPFMRPAWDSNRMRALNSITKSLANQIEKTRARLAKTAQA
jgi:HK97 gp10 family phage protein